LGYRLKPNLKYKSAMGTENFTNSLGFPDKEIPIKKTVKGEYRILFIGDSCTQNNDVAYENRSLI